MAISIVLLVVGLGVLTFSAEHFVVGAGRVALRLNISAVVVGAVVIGFGTSVPELLVSSTAAARNDLDLGTGNVIGSVVANLTLVLGVTAIIAPLRVSRTTLLREAPLSIAGVCAFAWMIQGDIGRVEGAAMAAATIGAVTFLVWAGRGDGHSGVGEVEGILEELDLDRVEEIDLGTEGLRTLAGLVGTVAGSQMLVEGSLDIANRAGISSGFIGLSLVAIGTSLPELVTSIVAVRKGSTDLVIGNLLGSNMFNGFAIGAAMALVGPGTVADDALTGFAALIMVGVVAISTLFMTTARTVVRWEAGVLLAIYLVSLPLLAIDSDDTDESGPGRPSVSPVRAFYEQGSDELSRLPMLRVGLDLLPGHAGSIV